MVEHFIYTENEISFEVLARETNYSWGKGIALEIIGSDGLVKNRVTFAVHPEFPRFEEFQSLTFQSLLNEVKTKLNSGNFAASWSEAVKYDLELFVPLNE